MLDDLPEVRSRDPGGPAGVGDAARGNVLHAVTSVLARQQIVAGELRVEQASLDDAFVALTGRALDS